ncbi:MAG: hypothetical protein WAZ50_02795 [Minisyncoccia bacterium]
MTDALNPCRFCGERDKLTFSDGAFPEQHWGVDECGQVLRCDDGQPTPDGDPRNGFDGVWCDICGAGAPVHVWNGSPDFLTRMRANIFAADAEFDDDGVWLGRPKVAA